MKFGLYSIVCIMSALFSGSACYDLRATKGKLTTAGLNYLKEFGLEEVRKHLRDISLPDESGSTSIKVGHVDYSLTGMKIIGFNFGTTNIATSPPNRLPLSLYGGFIDVVGNWATKLKVIFTIKDHGRFEAKANGINIDLTVMFNVDSQGKPQVSAGNCRVDIGGFSVKVHGGASWLYNLILDLAKSSIKRSLQKQICPSVRKAIDIQAEKALHDLQVTANIFKNINVDYSLVGEPNMTSNSLSQGIKGIFYPKENPEIKFPFPPPVISSPFKANNKMAQVVVSTYSANTFMYSAWKSGLMDIWITKAILPEKFAKYNLTTDLIAPLVPGFKKFPGRPLKLRLTATNFPQVIIHPNVTIIKGEGDFLTYIVLKQNETRFEAMNLHITFSVSAAVMINDEKIVPKLADVSVHLTLKSSAVGKVPVNVVNLLLKGALKVSIMPSLNKYLSQGYLIPSFNGLSTVNSSIMLEKDYVEICSNFKYNPN
ncbi:unnamed protein product [Clavelina lepadiformis]|uniref:Bactericidal permeability-increasing protein n=1 Tax=Clavelina lepadiformis TaxID=159417 RepID=A0ABP0FHZ3_CLALP